MRAIAPIRLPTRNRRQRNAVGVLGFVAEQFSKRLGQAGTIPLTDLITQQAQSQGIDPAIALAVAQQESGTSQWQPDGSLVTGSSGEIGVFQLMPATAAGLGVDPTDVNQNIQGGISLLSQLYNQFGNWSQALAAYNAGPGAVTSGKIPVSTNSYVNSVLGLASKLGVALGISSAADSISATDGNGTSSATPLLVLGGIAAVALYYYLED